VTIELLNSQPGHRQMAQVCASTGLTLEQLRGWKKTRNRARARQQLFFRLIVIEGWSLQSAGRQARKHHTTVLYGYRSLAHRCLGTPIRARREVIVDAWHGLLVALEFTRLCWALDVINMEEAA
jgi:hypothetical protein